MMAATADSRMPRSLAAWAAWEDEEPGLCDMKAPEQMVFRVDSVIRNHRKWYR
jgi:hypothetical protein